jgi:flavodoxin I
MNTTALINSFKSNKTAQVASKIKETWDNNIDLVDADTLTEELFRPYKNYILGVPTWFDGELPNYWDEFVPALEEMNLEGKKFAIFGNGDQKNYPENFVDGVGIMADLLETLGAEIVGFTSTEGYSFEKSKALRGEKFCGLALDFENQAKQNLPRIVSWVKQLKNELM